jgi:hypothetical protein
MISPTKGPLVDNTQHTQTGIHAPAGFERALPANEGPHTYALDRAVTGIGPDIRIVFDNVVRGHMDGFSFCTFAIHGIELCT